MMHIHAALMLPFATAGDWLLSLGAIKPVLGAMLLPPLGPLMLLLLGLWLIWRRKPRLSWAGRGCIAVSILALWLLSCQSVAIWLATHMLPQYPAVSLQDLRTQRIEAVVVLGGGIDVEAPEYGGHAQLNPLGMERLRYGVWLARALDVPLAFSGGVGWANAVVNNKQPDSESPPQPLAEARIAQEVAPQAFAYPLAMAETTSRDTRENGQRTAALLKQRVLTLTLNLTLTNPN